MKWFRTRSYRAIGYVWLFVCFWPPSPKPEWNIAWEWEIGNQNLPIGCFFFFVWPCRTGRSWPVQSPCPSLSSLRPFFFSIYIRKIRYLLRQRNKIHFQMFDLIDIFKGCTCTRPSRTTFQLATAKITNNINTYKRKIGYIFLFRGMVGGRSWRIPMTVQHPQLWGNERWPSTGHVVTLKWRMWEGVSRNRETDRWNPPPGRNAVSGLEPSEQLWVASNKRETWAECPFLCVCVQESAGWWA